MKFVILVHSKPQPWGHPTADYLPENQDLPPEKRQQMNTDFEAFLGELHTSGELVGGQALGDPATSTLYRWRDGEKFATDGPYAEAKEHFAGFFLIDVATRERAEEVASAFSGPGETIELRPVV